MIILSDEHKDIQKQLQDLHSRRQLTGCFNDIPNEVYHHPETPGVSSTSIKKIFERSVAHWVHEATKSPAFEFGSAMHVFMNEPHNFHKFYKVCPDDRRYLRETDDGRIILKQQDFWTIEVMARKLFQHPTARQLLVGAQNEISYFSYDPETGILKKCRVDAIKGAAISDLKSTMDAGPGAFANDCRKFLYRISAAFYLEVVSEVTGIRHDNFYLIACEKEEPHEIAVYRVGEVSLAKAGEEIRHVLRKLKTVKDAGPDAWTGYDLGSSEIQI